MDTIRTVWKAIKVGAAVLVALTVVAIFTGNAVAAAEAWKTGGGRLVSGIKNVGIFLGLVTDHVLDSFNAAGAPGQPSGAVYADRPTASTLTGAQRRTVESYSDMLRGDNGAEIPLTVDVRPMPAFEAQIVPELHLVREVPLAPAFA